MTSFINVRWTAIITLALGLVLAVVSGWFDREAIDALNPAHAHSATAMASRLFAVATVFIVLTVLEVQHSRTVSRLKDLEKEIEQLRGGPVGA